MHHYAITILKKKNLKQRRHVMDVMRQKLTLTPCAGNVHIQYDLMSLTRNAYDITVYAGANRTR